MEFLQTPTFIRQTQKLHKNQKKDLDEAVRTILSHPDIGEMKKGDLSGVQVYKFSMVNQLTLLAYEVHDEMLQPVLLSLGTHESFYRNLKRK